jgi:hypothetical protein
VSLSVSFYYMMPEIIRVKDRLASGLVDGSGEGVLQKIVYMLDQSYDQQATDVANLAASSTPDTCVAALLPYLTQYLGEEYPSGWSLDQKRNFVRSLVLLYKIKAGRHAWESILNLYGYPGYFPWELWKTDIYETWDYALSQDYDHRYKAARVDLRKQDETWLQIGRPEWLESSRPIHVLIRIPAEEEEWSDSGAVPSDLSAEVSEALASVEDSTDLDDEDLTITIGCTSWSCETLCQLSCTGGCESFCQAGACEAACQVYCEGACQTVCEITCQTSCQGGSCETACMASCQGGCELPVE